MCEYFKKIKYIICEKFFLLHDIFFKSMISFVKYAYMGLLFLHAIFFINKIITSYELCTNSYNIYIYIYIYTLYINIPGVRSRIILTTSLLSLSLSLSLYVCVYPYCPHYRLIHFNGGAFTGNHGLFFCHAGAL